MVSDDGQVYSIRSDRVLVQSPGKGGYPVVTLSRDGKPKTMRVHRIVLEAFVGPCPPGQQACHANDNASDNRLENLRWDTSRANCADRQRNSGHYLGDRTECIRGHRFTPENTRHYVKSDGYTTRICRTCRREHEARYREAKHQ